jgi:CheY-like chemotaxis protein
MGTTLFPDSMLGAPLGALHTDVLLVEDDDLVRYGLKRLLATDGRVCVALASAEEAQQLLVLHEPALVVTDFNLSGRWSGIDLLTWMWRSPRLRHVPMLLMTGADPAKVRPLLDAVGLGHVGILAKPFEGSELRKTLAQLAAARAIHRAGRGQEP